MGNLLLVLIFAFFSFLAVRLSAKLSEWSVSALRKKGRLLQFKGAWTLSLSIVTTIILMAFLCFGLSLSWLLTVLFQDPADVSSGLIAFCILGSLCVSWLWALAAVRNELAEIYSEEIS